MNISSVAFRTSTQGCTVQLSMVNNTFLFAMCIFLPNFCNCNVKIAALIHAFVCIILDWGLFQTCEAARQCEFSNDEQWPFAVAMHDGTCEDCNSVFCCLDAVTSLYSECHSIIRQHAPKQSSLISIEDITFS